MKGDSENTGSLWLDSLLQRYPNLSQCRTDIFDSYQIIKNAYLNRRTIFVCGNGGSAADAEHISSELMKGFLKKRPLPENIIEELRTINFSFFESDDADCWIHSLQLGLPAIPLTNNGGLATAISNDLGEDLVFAQQLLGLGQEGDVLLAISTSGNSCNVLKAVMVARVKKMKIIGLTGNNNGKLKQLCDVTIQVPEEETYKIQELHLPVYHCLCAMIEDDFFA